MSQLSIPFFMLGLSGIIYAPAASDEFGSGEFVSPGDIDNTFDAIERSRNLLIETARVYLPLPIVKAALRGDQISVQDVLRVRQDLFTNAFDYAHGKMSEKSFRTQIHDYEREFRGNALNRETPLRYSREETAAFRKWSMEQVEEARHQLRDWVSMGEAIPKRRNVVDYSDRVIP